jgi:proton glutamate symport protein
MVPAVALRLGLASVVFLRLIQSAVGPLMFGILVRAFVAAGPLREVGRLGVQALVYFEVVTTLALVVGAGAVWWAQPGAGLDWRELRGGVAAAPVTVGDVFERAVPASFLEALAKGEILPVIVFCLVFGLAASRSAGKERMGAFAEAVAEIMFEYTRRVMYLAPLAVCGALASTIASGGWKAVEGLGRFAVTAWAAQLFFVLAVLFLVLVLARVPLREFLPACREPVMVAFATTSSAAALPVTLAAMKKFGVPDRVLGVVAPLGLSFNLAGSTLHLAMVPFFVAQAAGVTIPFEQAMLILATLKLTSKSVAGIPRANFVVLTGLFTMFGLPVEALPMLLAIDPVIDMVRTSVNVFGHCVAPAALARVGS